MVKEHKRKMRVHSHSMRFLELGIYHKAYICYELDHLSQQKQKGSFNHICLLESQADVCMLICMKMDLLSETCKRRFM